MPEAISLKIGHWGETISQALPEGNNFHLPATVTVKTQELEMLEQQTVFFRRRFMLVIFFDKTRLQEVTASGPRNMKLEPDGG